MRNPAKEDAEQEPPAGFLVHVDGTNQRIMAVQTHHPRPGDPRQMSDGSSDTVNWFSNDPTYTVAKCPPDAKVVHIRAPHASLDAELGGKSETSTAGPCPEIVKCAQIGARESGDMFDEERWRDPGAVFCLAHRNQHRSLRLGVRGSLRTSCQQIAESSVIYTHIRSHGRVARSGRRLPTHLLSPGRMPGHNLPELARDVCELRWQGRQSSLCALDHTL